MCPTPQKLVTALFSNYFTMYMYMIRCTVNSLFYFNIKNNKPKSIIIMHTYKFYFSEEHLTHPLSFHTHRHTLLKTAHVWPVSEVVWSVAGYMLAAGMILFNTCCVEAHIWKGHISPHLHLCIMASLNILVPLKSAS